MANGFCARRTVVGRSVVGVVELVCCVGWGGVVSVVGWAIEWDSDRRGRGRDMATRLLRVECAEYLISTHDSLFRTTYLCASVLLPGFAFKFMFIVLSTFFYLP